MARLLGLVLLAALCATVASFVADVHTQLTYEALESISIYAGGQRYYFLPTSINTVAEANAQQDSDPTPELHFYDEKFFNASQSVIDLRDEIVRLVTKGDDDLENAGEQARTLLGQALGTLQDFYASTNWVELGNTERNFDLGDVTIEDAFGTSPCPDAPNVLQTSDLTSGYFSLICSPPPAGKCAHGQRTTQVKGTTSCGAGINKDAPGKRGFQAAYDLALNHTIVYVEGLLQDLLDHTSDHSSALRVFMRDQAQPDDDPHRDRCLPYCAVFTIVPGLIIITAIIVFVVGKNVVSSPFSSMSQQPRELQQSQPV